MDSAFGVDHGDISKKLGPVKPPMLTPGKHARTGANITGNYGEVPALNRSLRGKPGKHRKLGPVTKAATNPFKAFSAARKAKPTVSPRAINSLPKDVSNPFGSAKGPFAQGRSMPTAGSGAAKPLPKAQQATKEERLRSQGVGRLGVRNYQGGVPSGQARRRSGF